MQQNPGFLVLYSFIKDALLSKVGIVKVWWEERGSDERETYLDQSDDAVRADRRPIPRSRSSSTASTVDATAADAEAASSRPVDRRRAELHDVTVSPRTICAGSRACRRRSSASRATPASSATPTTASTRCCASEAELIEQGYDARAGRDAADPTSRADTIEAQARDTVDEGSSAAATTASTRRPR